jgi:nucleoside-diphosphate-sugar epimerase
MRYVVLGKNGFIGRNIFDYLLARNGPGSVIGFDRKVVDFTKPSTFSNYTPETGDIIIDCIARIDGNELEINEVNYYGFSSFIDYLKNTSIDFKYVYFSTYSTCLPEIIASNVYVRSKFLAEKYLRENSTNYQVIRLIFPFGKGEAKNRLISRLIGKIKSGETISIDRLTLNLTPITMFKEDLNRLINIPGTELNYSNNIETYLPDVVNYMQEQMGIDRPVHITDKEFKIVVDSPFGGIHSMNEIYSEIKSMLDE